MKTPFFQTEKGHRPENQISRLNPALRMTGNLPLKLSGLILVAFISSMCAQCKKDDAADETTDPVINEQYNVEQAISDEAQLKTISFDGLAFLTGNLGSQSFLPPGKVADYSGFQYLRDNDPTKLGHNTSFVTIIAFNVLNILDEEQIGMFISSANTQIDLINAFAMKRYPLMDAFRRLKEGDLPRGTATLSLDAVKYYTAELYRIDGQISYDRARLFGEVIGSMSEAQKNELSNLRALNGIGNWNSNISNPLEGKNLDRDISVAVMTYASEMYAWYAGTVTSDVYFCPERHGTYFGSFYLKDWPAMGNPNYTIDETLTASAGQNFLDILTESQSGQVKNIVNLQRAGLNELVEQREAVATELRKFLSEKSADMNTVLALSARYGELDGELSYYYATTFTEVYNSMSDSQKEQLLKLAGDLGYIAPSGGFLYSEPIEMPAYENSDSLFE